MQRSLLRLSFDEEPLPETSIDSLDLEKVSDAFRSRSDKLNQNQLLSLGVLTRLANCSVCSVGGVILFGKTDVRQRFFPDARVSCARFMGSDKAEFIDRLEVDGTILDALDAVPKFILRNTRLSSEIHGIYRRDVTEYPGVAIREALINAIAHCDYSLTGSRIQIAIFNDRLEIQNPGMLPFGFTLEDLKAGTSRIRNRVIARVFHELNIMETWGSGYNRIMQACHAEGYPEPQWQELGSALRVTFHPHPLSVIGNDRPLASSAEPLSLKEQAIFDALSPGESLAVSQIASRLAFTMPERSLRASLARLKQLGLLLCIGRGRATVWHRPK